MHIDIAHLIIVLVVILISMTLHEAMHGFMAYWLGDDTDKEQGRLALLGLPVFGGAKPVPYNPERVRGDEWGAALVGLAGPLTNFVIAFICFGLYATVAGPVVQPLLATAVSVNLGFFVFNMLPIPPLDGSRVLYALAPEFVRRGMEVVEQYGVMLVFVLVLVGSSAIGNVMMAAIRGILQLFSLVFGVSLG